KLRQRNPHSILITCWIAVVCGRLALPSAVNFDGVRHFLELFPPLAIVAAAPFVWSKRPLIRASLTTAAIAAMLVPLVRVHPFEAAYWNEFAGGLPGAMAKKIPQAGDYWAASYRLGLRWINEHAPPGSVLAVPIAEHTVQIVAPYRLRPDIPIAHISNAWSPRTDPRALGDLRQLATRRPELV